MNEEEALQVLLEDVHLALVDVVDQGHELGGLQPSHEDQLLLVVLVPLEQSLKEGTGGGEDQLMGLHFTILTGQGHIRKIIVAPQVSKCNFYVVMEYIPLHYALRMEIKEIKSF